MKCKHCTVPIVSREFPMLPGETIPSSIYWAHDHGNGVIIGSGHHPTTHYAEPVETLRKCKHCGKDITRKAHVSSRGVRLVWMHVHNDFSFCTREGDNNWDLAEPEPSPFTLYIHLKQTGQWERQDCASIGLRDYLRGVWQSAGHATAVGV